MIGGKGDAHWAYRLQARSQRPGAHLIRPKTDAGQPRPFPGIPPWTFGL